MMLLESAKIYVLPILLRSQRTRWQNSMKKTVSHDFQEETSEAKARWFQSLSLKERMDMLCFFTDLALQNNPDLVDQKDAPSAPGGVRVIERP